MNRIKSIIYSIYKVFAFSRGVGIKKYYDNAGKGFFQRLVDNIYWFFQEGSYNNNYYMQGADMKGVSVKEFLGTHQFLKLQKKANKALSKEYGFNESLNFLLKDKFVFGSFLSTLNIPIISSFFLIKSGKLISLINLNSISEMDDGQYFIKNAIIESGSGVVPFHIKNNEILLDEVRIAEKEFLERFSQGIWIVQPRFFSHAKIKTFNESALNTTRIYTMNVGTEIKVLGGFQAFATDNAKIDSWQYGSVYVGLDIEKGTLSKYGLTNLSDKREGLLEKHPNSQLVFENYELPYLREAADLCLKAHEFLYGFFIIGWDVAITDDGPVIVEANEKPGIHAVQSFTRGLKSDIKNGVAILKDGLNE
jgi:hypothetical protein